MEADKFTAQGNDEKTIFYRGKPIPYFVSFNPFSLARNAIGFFVRLSSILLLQLIFFTSSFVSPSGYLLPQPFPHLFTRSTLSLRPTSAHSSSSHFSSNRAFRFGLVHFDLI